jgi:hypothetical protein
VNKKPHITNEDIYRDTKFFTEDSFESASTRTNKNAVLYWDDLIDDSTFHFAYNLDSFLDAASLDDYFSISIKYYDSIRSSLGVFNTYISVFDDITTTDECISTTAEEYPKVSTILSIPRRGPNRLFQDIQILIFQVFYWQFTRLTIVVLYIIWRLSAIDFWVLSCHIRKKFKLDIVFFTFLFYFFSFITLVFYLAVFFICFHFYTIENFQLDED